MMRSLLISTLFSNLINAEVSTSYYDVLTRNGKQYYNVSNIKCKSIGKYLASVTSIKYNHILIEECLESGSNCWIGLVISNSHFRWIDETEIDIKLINKSLCNSIESIHETINNNSEYFGYINIENECWEISSNSSLKNMIACGPQKFDPTGTYWICFAIIPSILVTFAFFYSLYCIIYLIYHLFVRDYNYVTDKPSLTIKITAILPYVLFNICSILGVSWLIMNYIAFKQTGLLRPQFMFDKYYPDAYIPERVIASTCLAIWIIYLPTGYIHVCCCSNSFAFLT